MFQENKILEFKKSILFIIFKLFQKICQSQLDLMINFNITFKMSRLILFQRNEI